MVFVCLCMRRTLVDSSLKLYGDINSGVDPVCQVYAILALLECDRKD